MFFSFFHNLQADTSVPNYDDLVKQMADNFQQISKKFEESTGYHLDFDKDKFVQFGKSVGQQFSDTQKKLKEFYEANVITKFVFI